MNGRRYVIRSVAGWQIIGNSRQRSRHAPGMTIWVADEWDLGREVALWRTEGHSTPRNQRRAEITNAARTLARRLNAEHRRWLEQT